MNNLQHQHRPINALSMTTTTTTLPISTESPIVLIEEEPTTSSPPSYYASSHEDFSDFGNNNNHNFSLATSCVKYLYALSRMLVVELLMDWTSADNTSLLSKLLRCVSSLFSYTLLYTTLTGHLLWGIAYLMDHGWYLLASSGSVTLLLLSSLVLTSYEWMWRWQEHFFLPLVRKCGLMCGMTDAGSMVYASVATTTTINSNDDRQPQHQPPPQRRTVIIHDEEDMDDDLSVRGWLKRFARIFGVCVAWLLYCIVNIKVDFWITDQYMLARPEYHLSELQLVNCVEATPILLGAAILLYFFYPAFYHWHDAPAMVQDGIIAIAQGEDRSSGRTLEEGWDLGLVEQESTTLQRLL
jgi:hypothetical protein